MATILVDGGWIIPMRGDGATIPDGAVLIEGDRIAAVGPAGEVRRRAPKPDKVIDARGRAVLPGLVNTHTHLVGAFGKAVTEDAKKRSGGPFKRAIPLQEDHVGKDDVYFPALVHGIEMLKTGTTCINEMWWHQPEPARVARDLGIRAVVAGVVREMNTGRITPGDYARDWDLALAERNLDEAEALIEDWHGKEGGRITCRVAPDGPDRCTDKTLVRCKELADKHRVGLHTHVASVPAEQGFMQHWYGKRSVELLHDLGLLGPGMVAVHGVFVDEREIALLAATGTKFSHTAYLVGKRGYFPPMAKIYGAGIEVSLGTDWVSNDLWKTMRAAIILARVQSGDIELIDAEMVLGMATMGGARALGLDREIGSLEPGKKADIILVDTTTAWMNPIRRENVVSDLVYNANGSDVTDVLVDGRLVVEDKALKTLDEREVLSEAQKVAERVWARAKSLFGDSPAAAG